jgi:two-component system, cell cycle response regulator DivK
MPNTQSLSDASVHAFDGRSGQKSAVPRPLILVVDDHEDSRFLIRYLLEQRGCCVVGAADGLEAVETAHSSHPDLILMDVGLPVLDGLSATRRIREDTELRGVAVVAVSGYASSEDQARALEAGFDGYITKPINFDELYDTLSRLLPGHQTEGRGAANG